MANLPTKQLTIPDALNAYAAECMVNKDFRTECCISWRKFRDDSIGEDIANYTKTVLKAIDWDIRDEQIETIRRFPPEALRLLRSFITQFLSCPKEGPTTLSTRYEWEESRIPSISVTIDDHNDAVVTLRAPKLV